MVNGMITYTGQKVLRVTSRISFIQKHLIYLRFSKADLSPAQKISFAEQGYIEETGMFFADTDVVMESTYYYRVTSVDKSNNESGKSGQVVITFGDHAAPVKPAGLTALTGSRKGEIALAGLQIVKQI